MALGLYIEAVRNHTRQEPNYLIELDKKLGGLLPKCPECESPMVVYATRFRQGIKECICPEHGLVILEV